MPRTRQRTQQGEHNYRRRLLELAAAGAFRGLEPTVYRLDVLHDDWCAIFKGGLCDCAPDFRLRREEAN